MRKLSEIYILFFWFTVAGALGFVVDVGLLYLLKKALGLYLGRIISFLCAAATTWLFNRSITFGTRKSGHSRVIEFFFYVSLMLIGGTINYIIYAILVTKYSLVATHPIIGVAVGSAAGMLVNLVTTRVFLFRFQRLT